MEYWHGACVYCFACLGKEKYSPRRKYICNDCIFQLCEKFKDMMKQSIKKIRTDSSEFEKRIREDNRRVYFPEKKLECYLCERTDICIPVYLCKHKHKKKFADITKPGQKPIKNKKVLTYGSTDVTENKNINKSIKKSSNNLKGNRKSKDIYTKRIKNANNNYRRLEKAKSLHLERSKLIYIRLSQDIFVEDSNIYIKNPKGIFIKNARGIYTEKSEGIYMLRKERDKVDKDEIISDIPKSKCVPNNICLCIFGSCSS